MTTTPGAPPRPAPPQTPVDLLARLLLADSQRNHPESFGALGWGDLEPEERRTFQARARAIRDGLDGALRDSFSKPVNITGYDGAANIPVGATITRVYFCEPGVGIAADNAEFDTYADALEAAIARHESAEARHRAFHEETRGMGAYLPLPERFCIDVRWKMSWTQDPTAGIYSAGVDTVAKRTTYDTLDAGREHLARLRRPGYAPTLPNGTPYRPGER